MSVLTKDHLNDLRAAVVAMDPTRRWAPKFTDLPPGEFLSEVAENTTAHGDAGPVLWLIQDESDPDDVVTCAVTGNGPHGEAYATGIAFLVNNAELLLATLEAALAKPRTRSRRAAGSPR